jgi:hypothetical protein
MCTVQVFGAGGKWVEKLHPSDPNQVSGLPTPIDESILSAAGGAADTSSGRFDVTTTG